MNIAEQSATVALQAQTIIGLQAKLAEAQREADSMENQLDRLEEAATELTPYPEGYRPTAWEAVFELPGELRKARERLAEAERDVATWKRNRDLAREAKNAEIAELKEYSGSLLDSISSLEAKLAAVREICYAKIGTPEHAAVCGTILAPECHWCRLLRLVKEPKNA